MNPSVQAVADRLKRANSVVVITGAGVSAESGLRTFRGGTGATAADLPKDMQALWKEFDPMRLATPGAFDADPAMVTRWYDWRRLGCLAAEPNPGHLALARIERELTSRGRSFTLLTQNVDRLHQKAGSRNVVELHGSIIVWRCTHTHRKVEPPPEPFLTFPPSSPHSKSGLLRPDVVWFGEMLPPEALAAAEDAVHSCDLFFSIGTSSVVYPAAAYVQTACARGAHACEINPESTPISRRVDWSFRAKSGDLLPQIVEGAFGGG